MPSKAHIRMREKKAVEAAIRVAERLNSLETQVSQLDGAMQEALGMLDAISAKLDVDEVEEDGDESAS